MSQLSNRITKLEQHTEAETSRCPKCEAITVKTIVHYEHEEIADSEKVCECGREFPLMILTIENEPKIELR